MVTPHQWSVMLLFGVSVDVAQVGPVIPVLLAVPVETEQWYQHVTGQRVKRGRRFKTSLTSGTGVKIATHTIMYIADKSMKRRKKLVIL